MVWKAIESRKEIFLELAAKLVEEVNRQRGASGMPYARKAMIKYGLSKDAVSGKWQDTHTFDHLQVIIGKQSEQFEGNTPKPKLNNILKCIWIRKSTYDVRWKWSLAGIPVTGSLH